MTPTLQCTISRDSIATAEKKMVKAIAQLKYTLKSTPLFAQACVYIPWDSLKSGDFEISLKSRAVIMVRPGKLTIKPVPQTHQGKCYIPTMVEATTG